VPSAAWNDDIEFNFDLVDYDLEEFADLGSGQSSTGNSGGQTSVEINAFPAQGKKIVLGGKTQKVAWGDVVAVVQRDHFRSEADAKKKALSIKNFPNEETDHTWVRPGVYRCVVHDHCPHLTRLTCVDESGNWELYCAYAHTAVRLPQRRGAALSARVKNIAIPLICDTGATPQQILGVLRRKLSPRSQLTRAQVRNLKHRTNKGSVQSIETDAELSAALEPLHMAKIPPGTVPVDGSIVVVRTWNSGVLPPTMSSVGGATAHGFAITSPGMVRSLRALVELQALRMLPCLVAHLDCTWKNLNNGWATGVWGVSVLVKGGGIVETSSMDEQQRFLADAKISHSFVPLLLCSTKTENHFDMEQFMTAHTDMVHKFCGPTAVLNLDAVMMDHSHSLAGPVVSKGICDEILSCYFHVIKNVNENKAKLKYKASLPLVLEDVRRLHMSRSEEQFAAMAIVFLKRWTDAGEEAFADYFRGAHLSGVFAKWHIAAGPQRLPCTNNALESFNNYGIKMVMARDRATLGAWLSNDGVLQKVLGEIDATRTLDAKQLMPFLSQRDLRSFNPPGRQTLQKALGILHASGSHTALERPGEGQSYLISSDSRRPVTSQQVERYMASLDFLSAQHMSYEDFQGLTHLHHVRILPTTWEDPLSTFRSPDLPFAFPSDLIPNHFPPLRTSPGRLATFHRHFSPPPHLSRPPGHFSPPLFPPSAPLPAAWPLFTATFPPLRTSPCLNPFPTGRSRFAGGCRYVYGGCLLRKGCDPGGAQRFARGSISYLRPCICSCTCPSTCPSNCQ